MHAHTYTNTKKKQMTKKKKFFSHDLDDPSQLCID